MYKYLNYIYVTSRACTAAAIMIDHAEPSVRRCVDQSTVVAHDVTRAVLPLDGERESQRESLDGAVSSVTQLVMVPRVPVLRGARRIILYQVRV